LKVGEKVRKIWHDVFVGMNNKRLFLFADTCKNVVTRIDLDEKERSFFEATRFRFHLSMCQACMNYYRFSRSLSNEVKKLSPLTKPHKHSDLDSLQKRLMAEMVKPKQESP
jgi:hypothetical protein